MGRITRSARVTRIVRDDGRLAPDTRADALAVEEPLEIRVDGQSLTTTMRTPGHDFELVTGLLHAEGLIAEASDILTMRYCAGSVGPYGENTYNVIDVTTRAGHMPIEFIRNVTTTSACGICGTASIEQLMKRQRHEITPVRPSASLLMSLPAVLQQDQHAFRRTGGIHAAGAFTLTGEPLIVREDVGRHNAADKVIGALLQEDKLPARELLLVMSSRASFELVQKAILAGFSGLVAVSAATSLAVDLAKESGLLLTGFTRENRMNVYSGEVEIDEA